jgi:RNA polymerase sigma factor (TIGR02999 family)
MTQVTQILLRAEQGDSKAAEELLPLVYNELRKLAAAKMAHERPGQTLQPTALVHEAWLRLTGDVAPQFKNRAHFFGAAAEAMRRILIERARRRLAIKRGSGAEQLDIDEMEIASPVGDDDGLLVLNDALEKFANADPRKAELVKLRYFAGMSFEETATALDIAVPTAKQWWAYARAWLAVEMRANPPR